MPRAMPNQTTTARNGTTAINGRIVDSAMLAASSRLTFIGCATCTT